MKPYHEEAGITIFHGDAREVLPMLPKVDLVLTDPPYGVGLRNGDVDGHRSKVWDRIAGDEDQAIGLEILEALRGIPTIAFASPWLPWPGKWRNLIVWDKGGAVGGGGDIATCLKRSWELIQVRDNLPMQGSRGESVWRFPIVPFDTSQHIAAKPVALLQALLRQFGGELILDPFMGSGTTLVAAKQLGRRAIGIEIDERYCEMAVERLRQSVLDFGPAPADKPEQFMINLGAQDEVYESLLECETAGKGQTL